jgi:hypothetical protein
MIASAQSEESVNASYLAELNAPFGWEDAQTRVANALRPT